MKIFALLLLVGIASASLISDVERAVDSLVDKFENEFFKALTLKKHLGKEEVKIIDEVEGHLKSYVTRLLRKDAEETKKLANYILKKAHGSARKVESSLEQFDRLLKKEDSLIENLFVQLKSSTEENLLSSFLELFGKDGKKLIREAENVTSKLLKPEKVLNVIIRELTSSKAIKDLRAYIRTAPKELEEALELPLKEIESILSDSDMAELIKYVLSSKQSRGIFDIFNKIKDWFVGVGETISDKFGSFKNWVKDNWDSVVEKVKEKSGMVTAIAKEFVSHAKNVSSKVAKKALEFFKEHKDEIAKTLFTTAITAAKTAILAG